jgi:hypothetical protein
MPKIEVGVEAHSETVMGGATGKREDAYLRATGTLRQETDTTKKGISQYDSCLAHKKVPATARPGCRSPVTLTAAMGFSP